MVDDRNQLFSHHSHLLKSTYNFQPMSLIAVFSAVYSVY